MPVTLAKTTSKIQLIPNSTNAQLVKEMYEYLKSNGASERHQHNALKVMIPFANHLGPATIFFDIKAKEQILAFLDTNKKRRCWCFWLINFSATLLWKFASYWRNISLQVLAPNNIFFWCLVV